MPPKNNAPLDFMHDTPARDTEFRTTLWGMPFIFHATWGLFSPRNIDEGSRLLVENTEVTAHDTILEIGCGYGPIGLSFAKRAPQGTVHMVDKDFVAVDYAKKNAVSNGINNACVYLSNGFSHVPDQRFDLIVSNLPAKAGNEFYALLFQDAKAHLALGGRLCVVTLSGIRACIKRNFLSLFGNYEKIKQGTHYTISQTRAK